MIEINEIKAQRILNPTSIDLGEYVINPFKGCEFGCIYCYVRGNKTIKKDPRKWGEFIDIRINAPELLKKELKLKKVKRVLLGSTTECFQPADFKYKLMEQILNILIDNQVTFNILTRSPLILNYIPLLKKGFCESIYFTFNDYAGSLKKKLEPESPSFTSRINAINQLLSEKLCVIPYFSPILPFISDFDSAFSVFPDAKRIEFEALNFNLGNTRTIMELIQKDYPHLKNNYSKLITDPDFYNQTWKHIKKRINDLSLKTSMKYHLYQHDKNAFFENKYK